jgi:hypothetical protein
LLKIQPDLAIVPTPGALDAGGELYRRAPAIIGRRTTPQRALALVQRIGVRVLCGVQGPPPEAQVPAYRRGSDHIDVVDRAGLVAAT